jgi:hypothetical protein
MVDLFSIAVLQGFETYSQFSFRNLCLVSLDWVRLYTV